MKKAYSIDPSEYTSKGKLYRDESIYRHTETDGRGDSIGSYRKNIEAHESYSSVVAQRDHLLSFKRRTERYEAYYILDFSLIEWVCYRGESGAKSAYTALVNEVREGGFSDLDTENLTKSKGYFIYSPKHYGEMDALLEDLKRCRLERLGSRVVGCLILNDDYYVFFWTKVLSPQ